jgi:hypothetical protein
MEPPRRTVIGRNTYSWGFQVESFTDRTSPIKILAVHKYAVETVF